MDEKELAEFIRLLLLFKDNYFKTEEEYKWINHFVKEARLLRIEELKQLIELAEEETRK